MQVILMNELSKILIYLGIILIILGLILNYNKFNIGKLPGDIVIERDNFKLYLPITTSIIVSLLITIIIWLIGKIR